MNEIIKVEDSIIKSQICEQVLRSLPKWFGIESAIVNYIRDVAAMDTWAFYDNQKPVGFISIHKHNAYAAEIHVMGVLESHQRQHIGKLLFTEAENYLIENKFHFLQVKTLSESRECEEYKRTRIFYLKMGFLPLEEFKTLWDEANPCLLLIKSLIEKKGDYENSAKRTSKSDIESVLSFIQEADQLKTIDRHTLIYSGERKENSAEHSWHLALAVLSFQTFAPTGFDINKAIKMAILHDIVEIDAGDTLIYDDQSAKKTNELKAAERIFSILPNDIENELKSIWLEFEEGLCAEAKFVSAIDRFLPIFSNYLNDAYSWKNHQITLDQIVAKNKPPIIKGFPYLWSFAEKMIKETLKEAGL
jgi:putative hydrolase of HD superfamily